MPRHHDRCSGHCCENFSVPASPEELEANYRRWLADGAPVGMNNHHPRNWYQDIHLIYPMVVYLGHTDNHPPKINPTDEDLKGEGPPKYHRYRCKHLDPETRDCTIYEIRPEMCRSYPDGQGCNYADCTWDEVRQEIHTTEELERRKAELTPLDNEIQIEKPKDPEPEPEPQPKTTTCDACGNEFSSTVDCRCNGCNAVLCHDCWAAERCLCCELKASIELPKTATCDECGAQVVVVNTYRCACSHTVCVDCWSHNAKKCLACVKVGEGPK